MRPDRGVRMLAAVVTAAAITAPAAQASAIGVMTDPGQSMVAVAHHHAASTNWELIALSAGGTIVLLGAGVDASRGFARRQGSAGALGTTSGS
jgi:hypothetical protein